jgi:hypothetical protein
MVARWVIVYAKLYFLSPRFWTSVPMFSDTHGERPGPCFSGLYPMYTHMIKQRRKVFGGKKLGAKPKTL